MGKAPSESPRDSLDALAERLSKLSALGWHMTTGPESELERSSPEPDSSARAKEQPEH